MNEIEELKKFIDYLRNQGPGKPKCLDMIETRINQILLNMRDENSESKFVEIPSCADEVIKEGIALGASKVEIVGNAESYSTSVQNDEFSKWFKENGELFLMAVANGYTVAKEPLYYVPVPHLSEVYYTQDDGGVLDVSYGIGSEFTSDEVKRLFPGLEKEVVPVEKEAE